MSLDTEPAARSRAARRGTAHRPSGSLSLSQARRVALRAQGLDRPRRPLTGPATARHLQQVVDRLGLLQIDSVNVLARAHLMPLFSRIGSYDTALLDRAAGRAPRRLVETWAHEASFIPPRTYPLLAWRRRAYRDHAWGVIKDAPLTHAPLVAEVHGLLADRRGGLTARQVQEQVGEHAPRTQEWGWNWSAAKRVLEYLFFTGEVAVTRRGSQFERVYDLADRVLPADVLAAEDDPPTEQDAVRELLTIAARAHGVATERCLLDYFRLRGPVARGAVRDLVEEGVLVPVSVEGWSRPVYLHAEADLPRRATGRALLSPFDPLVFERRRVEDLFGLRYRIEIYVPASQRVHGYYVLPYLHGERLAALLDLKADRRAGVLQVVAAHPGEQSASTDPEEVLMDLADELFLLARWSGLDRVEVVPGCPGALTAPLSTALAGVG